nr:MAG TPA: hypothetical protein [Caudoviricetes sp.]
MYISMLSKVQTSLNNFYDALNSIIHLDFNIKSNRLILCTSDQKVKDLNDLFQYHLKSLLLQSVHNKQTVPIINMLQDISLHINERVNHYNSLCRKFTDQSIPGIIYDIMYNKLWYCAKCLERIKDCI